MYFPVPEFAPPRQIWLGAGWMMAGLCILIFAAVSAIGQGIAPRVLFETGFEAFEGYSAEKDLVGQNGWTSFGTAGNGVFAAGTPGFSGQAAYIGFNASPSNDFFNIFRPLNLTPTGSDLPVVQFTVSLQIEDSTTNHMNFDDFRWSVYNTKDERLFTLDFANEERLISYLLDDEKGFHATGLSFRNGEPYDLAVTINFSRNLWSATINGATLVSSAPITTRNAKLDLADIDAVWAIRTAGSPGDNFMIFDDYKITAQAVWTIPPVVEARGILDGTQFLLRVYGEPGVIYAMEATTDFFQWSEINRKVAQSPGGVAEFMDPLVAGRPARAFRARAIPPNP
ncbi:MAG: hypothetical protein EXS36_20685 [Pedosphaera sp.]|nr:hypothetical protein [Pedosphaera sp.]